MTDEQRDLLLGMGGTFLACGLAVWVVLYLWFPQPSEGMRYETRPRAILHRLMEPGAHLISSDSDTVWVVTTIKKGNP